MIALDFPQKSMEWILNRLWRLTASKATSCITSTGKLSKSVACLDAIDKMHAGLELNHYLSEDDNKEAKEAVSQMDDYELQNFLCDFTGDKFKGNAHTLRGNTFEHVAMAELSDVVGEQFYESGMVIMGDEKKTPISCSPDGQALKGGKPYKYGEVKCPSLAVYNGYATTGKLPSKYKLQVHFSMAVCEVDEWHFGAKFVNPLITKPLIYIPVKRDSYTDQVEQSLKEFHVLYEQRWKDVGEKIINLYR